MCNSCVYWPSSMSPESKTNRLEKKWVFCSPKCLTVTTAEAQKQKEQRNAANNN